MNEHTHNYKFVKEVGLHERLSPCWPEPTSPVGIGTMYECVCGYLGIVRFSHDTIVNHIGEENIEKMIEKINQNQKHYNEFSD